MLKVTRKRGEAVRIGSDVVVTIKYCSKGRVILGIEAPRHVKILRLELEDLDSGPPPANDCSDGQ